MGRSKKKKDKISCNFEIVTREEWGAATPSSKPVLLEIPVKYVRYSYTYTKEDDCVSVETCSEDLRRFQEKLMGEDYPDLPYNFLIGKDGRVYEGRGWYLDVAKHDSYKKFRRKCLDVSYMGDFKQGFPPEQMTDVAADLVEHGIKLKLIRSMPKIETLNDFRDYCYFEDQKR